MDVRAFGSLKNHISVKRTSGTNRRRRRRRRRKEEEEEDHRISRVTDYDVLLAARKRLESTPLEARRSRYWAEDRSCGVRHDMLIFD